MSKRYLITGLVGVIFIFAYNVWLVQRDQKLFDAYSEAHPICTEYTFQIECNQ
jgi:hypothetical protein